MIEGQSGDAALAGKRVMVIGASGFFGSPIVQRLVDGGAAVLAVSRSALPSRVGALTWRPLDATDLPALLAEMAAFRPHILYHLTSDSYGGRELELLSGSIQNDLVATVNALTAAKKCGVETVVMTGSMEEPLPDDPYQVPLSPYAAAKWAGVGYGRMFRKVHGLDVRIVRPMLTYGPGQKPYKLIPATILALLRGEDMTIASGERLVDWVYIDDIADAMVSIADPSRFTGYAAIELGSGELRSIADVARMVAGQLGLGHRLHIGTANRGEEMVRAARTEEATALLGHPVARTPMDEGIARTIAWYADSLKAEAVLRA